MYTLELNDLRVETGGAEIIKGLNLKIRPGEMHVIMGPNGSGKSTLCNAIMGHPRYVVTGGDILFGGKSVLKLSTDKRARLGIFLGFQYPQEIAGLTFGSFLRTAGNAIGKARDKSFKPAGPVEFYRLLEKEAKALKYDSKLISRNLNEGFSGGEKKRAEVLQLAVLKPKFAMMDEIDSGLDIDALKTVAEGIDKAFKKNRMGLLLITHYQRILNYLRPDFVHVMADGEIVKSGGRELAHRLEKEGYAKLVNKH
jgi:Fe-S cluster assembly ATP-binding protein